MADVVKEKTTYRLAYHYSMVHNIAFAHPYHYSMTITNKGVKMEYAKILEVFSAIDFSCNKFEGEIPEVVGSLKGIRLLSISNNNLVGPIPKGQQFDTFDNSSFDGNSGLCGLPLSRKCDNPKASPPLSSPSKGNEDFGLLVEFGWKAVALGYGCGFLLGVVIGNIVFAKIRKWLMRTCRIRVSMS
ncbi:hypothetical protein SLA2020_337050 [Shorea laevis]